MRTRHSRDPHGGLRTPRGSNQDVFNDFLGWAQTHKQPSTTYSYRQSLVSLGDWLGGTHISVVDVDQLAEWLHRERRTGKPAAAATIKRETMTLRTLFKWMGGRELLVAGRDPSLLLLEEIPVVDNARPRPVEFEVWREVWSSNMDDDLRVALGLGLFCGMRRFEITGLRGDQYVDGQLVAVRRKGGKRKPILVGACVALYGARLGDWLPDPTVFLESLQRLTQARSGEMFPWGDRYTPGVNPDQLNKHVTPHVVSLGLAPDALTPHMLRHSFCTNLVAVGVAIQDVAEMAGHSSYDITRRYVELGSNPLAKYIDPQPAASLTAVPRWG